MRPILDVVVELHDALNGANIRHAFGGAFALLWCTGEPRTTIDIDLNLFVEPEQLHLVLAALPQRLLVTPEQHERFAREGQVRLTYDEIPVDIFLSTSDFHADVQLRTSRHELADRRLPFLSCSDLAVFKAFFNRRKDWADIEEMVRADQIDVASVVGILTEYLGEGDPRVVQLMAIRNEVILEAAAARTSS